MTKTHLHLTKKKIMIVANKGDLDHFHDAQDLAASLHRQHHALPVRHWISGKLANHLSEIGLRLKEENPDVLVLFAPRMKESLGKLKDDPAMELSTQAKILGIPTVIVDDYVPTVADSLTLQSSGTSLVSIDQNSPSATLDKAIHAIGNAVINKRAVLGLA